MEEKNWQTMNNETCEISPAESMKLTEEERQAVKDYSAKIDIRDTRTVIRYVASARKGVAELLESAAAAAKTRELGETGALLGQLMSEVRGPAVPSGKSSRIFDRLRRAGKKVSVHREKYNRISGLVETFALQLEEHQLVLMKDIQILEQLHEKTLEYFKVLSLYIQAGQLRLRRERETTLASMREIARRTELSQDARNVKDFENTCAGFEGKLRDMEFLRAACLQMALQIRLLKNCSTALSEQIRAAILQTLPQWKQGLAHLLNPEQDGQTKTADGSSGQLKDGVEAPTADNEKLLFTLDEILRIQAEGTQKRHVAAAELRQIRSALEGQFSQFDDLG